MNRRRFLFLSSAVALAGAPRIASAAPLKELRIGYQKSSVLIVVKAQKVLESHFEPQGVAIRWIEFPYGPPLLEALNVGAIDYGYTGNAPPVFAQAAHANIQYVAVIPARGDGEAIVVPEASPLKSLADLKGKRVAVAKGSSANDLLAAALESAKIPWSDITPVYLAPADAAAAFSRGSVDAWSIWDPFYAIAETKQKARPLPIDPDAAQQNSFFLANSNFISQHADVIGTINATIATATAWAGEHPDETAAVFSEVSGVDLDSEKRAIARTKFNFGRLDDKIIAQQQAVADRFARLGLIPEHVTIRDIVWTAKSNS